MQVVVESTQGLGRRMTITLVAEQIEQAINTELQRRAKTLRINGFRPGRVPLAIVKQHQGESVRQAVQSELMQRNFEQAIVQQALRPAGRVQFVPQASSAGEDFSYQAAFEIYPQIILQGLQAIVVEQPHAEVTDADVEDLLLRLRRPLATWYPAEGAARLGDRVTINFRGSIAGEAFEGGTASDFVFILGENNLVAGFDEGIIGHQLADEFTIEITFPATYQGTEKLQGKTAQFLIQLIQAERCVLPEWSPEVVKQFGIADGKLESLKCQVRATMIHELQRSIKQRVKSQILNGLLEQHADLMIPESLVDQVLERHAEHHTDHHRERQVAQLSSDRKSPDSPLSSADQLRERAQRWVSINLLLEEVIKQRALQLDPVQVDRVLEEITAAYADPAEMVSYYRNNRELMKSIYPMALKAQAIESLLATATVTEKQFSFSELVRQSA